jgi:hypothetical protein
VVKERIEGVDGDVAVAEELEAVVDGSWGGDLRRMDMWWFRSMIYELRI